MAQTYRRPQLRRTRVLLLILLVLVSAAGVWLMGYVSLRVALGKLERLLDKFRLMPPLMELSCDGGATRPTYETLGLSCKALYEKVKKCSLYRKSGKGAGKALFGEVAREMSCLTEISTNRVLFLLLFAS